MTRRSDTPTRFGSDLVSGLDEPVRRYFGHAIADGAPLAPRVRLTMEGRIKVGRWLPFSAEQEIDGRSFVWRARTGWGPFTPLQVVDRYADGAGAMHGRLLGRLPLFGAEDDDTTRSAAGRTALESVAFAPMSVLPQRGVTWCAESEDLIVGRFELAPERPEVQVRIDNGGGVRRLSALRWGDAGQRTFGYIPCGGEVHAEQRFGGMVIPSEITVGWWFDTPDYAPFFKARILDAVPAA